MENKASQYSCNNVLNVDTCGGSSVIIVFLHVLMIKTNSLGVGKLPDLFHGFEAIAVCFELVGQTGGLGGELPGDVPDARGKLVPVKVLHGGEVGALAGEILVTGDRHGQEAGQEIS